VVYSRTFILLLGIATLVVSTLANASSSGDGSCSQIIRNKWEEKFAPFDNPDRWKYRFESDTAPFVIYTEHVAHESIARTALNSLERAWGFALKLGFDPPPILNPLGEEKFPIFLVEGVESGVEPIEEPVHHKDDEVLHPFMALDVNDLKEPAAIDSFIAHELHHLFQISYSWGLPTTIHEMSANYFQEAFSPGQNHKAFSEVQAFQARPEWPVFLEDFESDFMYGAWLYFKFLELNYFESRPEFLRNFWEQFRQADRGTRKYEQEDLVQALTNVLPGSISHDEALLEFALWRTFLFPGAREQSLEISERHFGGMKLPGPKFMHRIDARDDRVIGKIEQVYGTHYVEVANLTAFEVELTLNGSPDVRWVLQQVTFGDRMIAAITALPHYAGPAPSSLSYELKIRTIWGGRSLFDRRLLSSK